MKLLITGSRTWDDVDFIERTLHELRFTPEGKRRDVLLLSGGCPFGADVICEDYARDVCGWQIERFEADWERYGKKAGYIRNAHMVEQDPDLCLAFIRDGSPGASMTANLAEKHGIPTIRYTYTPRGGVFRNARNRLREMGMNNVR